MRQLAEAWSEVEARSKEFAAAQETAENEAAALTKKNAAAAMELESQKVRAHICACSDQAQVTAACSKRSADSPCCGVAKSVCTAEACIAG